MAAVLLVCGGLLFSAYNRVQHVDPGFRPDHVLTFMVHLPNAVYGGGEDGKKVVAFWDRLGVRFSALPGAEAVGIISCPPLSCHWGNFFVAEGQPPRRPGEANPVVLYRPASAGYFKATQCHLQDAVRRSDHRKRDEHQSEHADRNDRFRGPVQLDVSDCRTRRQSTAPLSRSGWRPSLSRSPHATIVRQPFEARRKAALLAPAWGPSLPRPSAR